MGRYRVKPLLILYTIIFLESMSMTLVFPFIYFMIGSFKDLPENEIGLYCGICTACFSLGESFTSLLWGSLSDRYGRRPILLTGLLFSNIAIILFGFATSTIWACLLRFFCGSCYGTISVAKAAFNEISTSKTKPFIFSLIGIFWSLGSIVGPIVGGVFSDPSLHFPTLFTWPVFTKYPYLLPCIIQAFIGVAGFIVGLLHLPETANFGVYQFLSTIDLVEDTEEQPDTPDQHRQVFSPDPASTLFLNTSSRMDIQKMFRQLGTDHQSSFANTEELFDAQSEGIVADDHLSHIDEDDTSSSNSISPYFLSSTHIILAYGLIHFQNIFFEEIYALWGVAPLGIGLGFTSETFGIILFFVGLIAFVFAIFYPYIATSSIKILRLYQISFFIYLSVWVSLPYIAWRTNTNDKSLIWTEGFLFVALSLRRLANILAFTSANILLQYSTTPMSLAAINGMAATLGSFLRSIGPIIAGFLWSYSIIEGNAPPFNKYLVFFVLSLLSILGFFHSFFIWKK